MNAPVHEDSGPRSSEEVPLPVVQETSASGPGISEPSLLELAEALQSLVDGESAMPPGVAEQLMNERAWGGRLLEVLSVLTEDCRTMGYLAGGHFPGEVMTSLSIWAESPLSLEEIRSVVPSGGWDPEPFVVLARAGLLDALFRRADGSPRRIRGELAGAWVSDELALADDADILERVRRVLDDDQAPPGSSTGATTGTSA
jgi:hypothetical protein